jgi:hypothetical protein
MSDERKHLGFLLPRGLYERLGGIGVCRDKRRTDSAFVQHHSAALKQLAPFGGWRSVENRLRDDALRSEARRRGHDDDTAPLPTSVAAAFDCTFRLRRAVVAGDDDPLTLPGSPWFAPSAGS